MVSGRSAHPAVGKQPPHAAPAGATATAAFPWTHHHHLIHCPARDVDRDLTVYLKMLTARAMTRATVTSAMPLWTSISIFAQRVSGIVSVGLNAVALVKLT